MEAKKEKEKLTKHITIVQKNLKIQTIPWNSIWILEPLEISSPWIPPALACEFPDPPLEDRWVDQMYKSSLQVYMEQIFTCQSPQCYSKPASRAPGSVKAAALVGWATGAAGGAGAGGGGAVGILTNCSLINSFSLCKEKVEKCKMLKSVGW